ncbi:MAG: hypothetical protein JSU63_08170, partial [Phycisphaerales bacterium]
MCIIRWISASVEALLVLAFMGAAWAKGDEPIKGERLDPSSYGPSYIESMDAAIERDRLGPPPESGKRGEEHRGAWVIPSRSASKSAHSGAHYVVNKWGDTRMGIGFPERADVHGAFFAGQSGEGVWTTGIRVFGFRGGEVVGETDWFTDIGADPKWFAMNLYGVDRIEIDAIPVIDGVGFYAMDDLTFSWSTGSQGKAEEKIVVDFDDLFYRQELTGSAHAGLSWEAGAGECIQHDVLHAPVAPPSFAAGAPAPQGTETASFVLGDTHPRVIRNFRGVIRGDANSTAVPPDSHGAVGPNHYVEVVNRNFAVYDKGTGAELVNLHLYSFQPGTNGDPRVVFDHHSGRWIVISTDFMATSTIFLAVSLTDDPTEDWFKTRFCVEEFPVSCWPDYPTLGVDANGIYISARMCDTTIFAIDKAPLVAPLPSRGTITAFRELPWEGAVQPAHTYGTPPGEYFVSIATTSSLRIRRVDPPLTSPTLVDVGTISVPALSTPPSAPALGSTTPLDTGNGRMEMSVYRDGSLWTTQTVDSDGRAAVRWYEIDANTLSLVQSGTVADSSLHFFYPSIMVNQVGTVVLGFSGSNSAQYAGCYYTGRVRSDPPGEMGIPVRYRAGTAPYTVIDYIGRNRWGDYSYTTLDPVDDLTLWTIQEYTHEEDTWGTSIAAFSVLDCDGNTILDECDLDCGTAGGKCDVAGCGEATDCNLNTVPDACETDCNANGVLDECDIAQGTSSDVDGSGIPDECEVRPPILPPSPHSGRKNRYVSISPDSHQAVAYQVEMTESAFFPESTGVLGWVGEPDANDVSRVADEPYFDAGWPEVVHIGDCEIIPAA